MSDADVIVIGSGFGGAIAANRLAADGHKVLVLERGPWRDSLPVRSMGIRDRAPFPYGAKAFTHFVRNLRVGPFDLDLNKAGLFEVNLFGGLRVISASAVGGGSHAWGALLAAPQDPDFWRGRHPALAAGDVEQHHDRVLEDLGAVRLSPSHALAQSIWSHLPPSNGRRCAPSDPQPWLAMQLPASADEAGQIVENADGVQRAVCAFDGDSFLGSRGGAKASVDCLYLHSAMANGATVRDLCEVTAIRRAPASQGGGYSIRFRDRRGKRPEVATAQRVVLAAGTLNTLRLLHASAALADGLTPMPTLGRGFGANGDLIGLWFKQSTQPSMFESPPLLGQFEVDGNDIPCVTLAGLPGFDTLPLPGPLKRRLARTVVVGGMGADSGRGRAAWSGGRLRVDYDARSEPVYDRTREAFRALEEDSGCKTWSFTTPLTVHPLGGAALGPDADHGVIDHRGEVYGNPGLFVADGAALPAAPGTPPTLSIAAWAHHVAGALSKSAP